VIAKNKQDYFSKQRDNKLEANSRDPVPSVLMKETEEKARKAEADKVRDISQNSQT